MPENSKKPLTYAEAWNAQPDGCSRAELFQAIMDGIRGNADSTLTPAEAQQAARNLISFCRELIGLSQDETIGVVDFAYMPAIDDREQE